MPEITPTPATSATPATEATPATPAPEPAPAADDLTAIKALADELGITPGQLKGRLEASRKWETRAKENAEKATEYDKFVESQKTEQQKLEDARAAAEKRAADTAAELARMKAAVKHGLTEDDLALLGSGTPEEIEERAEKLAARLKVATPAAPSATGLGTVGTPIPSGTAQLKREELAGMTPAQINQARAEGRLVDLGFPPAA